MAADAVLFELGMRQLAALIPFEGVAQPDAFRTLPTLMKFAAAKLRIYANQPFLHRELHLEYTFRGDKTLPVYIS
jgi:hypothetical protein